MDTITKESVQYSNLPYLETLDDVARYIIDMTEDQAHYFMPAIHDAFRNFRFSQAQLGLVEKFASAKLSRQVESLMVEPYGPDMAERLENAFWEPLIVAADSVISAGEGNDQHNEARRRTMALFLYATLQSNVSNLRLFLQSSDRDMSENTLRLAEKFASKNEFRLHTAMDANQALHVISKGILPQLRHAIERECGIAPQQLNQARQTLYKIASQERGIVQNMDFMMPVDPLPWMRFGTLPAHIVREEIDFSIREARRLLPPPV
ncbi:MAG: hypothetical protein ACK4VI_05300 [Alphaproteobacteria bacterium]